MTEAQAEAVRQVIAEMREGAERHFFASGGAFRRGGFLSSDREFVKQETLDAWANKLEAALGEAEPVNPLTSPPNR